MSSLGILIGYTGEACPKCGRYRIEQWSRGRRVCEKCHYCLEDDDYYFDELDDENESGD